MKHKQQEKQPQLQADRESQARAFLDVLIKHQTINSKVTKSIIKECSLNKEAILKIHSIANDCSDFIAGQSGGIGESAVASAVLYNLWLQALIHMFKRYTIKDPEKLINLDAEEYFDSIGEVWNGDAN